MISTIENYKTLKVFSFYFYDFPNAILMKLIDMI
jgi:hypothetical protein